MAFAGGPWILTYLGNLGSAQPPSLLMGQADLQLLEAPWALRTLLGTLLCYAFF